MDFMDISKMRITVRRFDPRPVEQEKIEKILEAGRWSPTAVNAQPQRVLVLNTPENLAKVREFCTFGYDKKYADLNHECDDREHGHNVYYYGSPLVLFVCYDRTACWYHPPERREQRCHRFRHCGDPYDAGGCLYWSGHGLDQLF